MKSKYSIESYDVHLCLKFNDNLWLILLFLLRPYLVTIISLFNKDDRSAFINIVYSDKIVLWWGLLATIPAILVVYALKERKPDGSSFARKLWHRGRELLSMAAIFSAAIVFVPLWMGVVHRVDIVGWVQLGISLGVVVALYSSSYIRDCFAEFPVEADADGSGAS